MRSPKMASAVHEMRSPKMASAVHEMRSPKMASASIIGGKGYHATLSVLLIAISVLLSSFRGVKCVELDVGGDNGWATPPSKKQHFYNDWASNNRFQVNDTLRFRYKGDSVMVVAEEEYRKCGSSHPIFFSNNGDTVYTLDRPGLFYFISGVAGHCHKGMNMVVKVLEPPQQPKSSAAAAVTVAAAFGSVPSLVGAYLLSC